MNKIVFVTLMMADDMHKRHFPVDGNSLIEYSGNRKSGHYTAKVCQDNKWYSISDSYYRSIEESEIYYKSAIILFYKIVGY